MRKLVLFPALLLFGSLLLAFTSTHNSIENLNDTEIGYLPSNYDEAVHFQIDSQEPCDILKVNPDTGALSLRKKRKG